MKIAIIQPNYLPWKGYFDIIKNVDHFVFLDDVQYTRVDWRNRNRIKTSGGIKWISVPVFGHITQKIFQVKIDNTQPWVELHKKMIHYSYAKSPFYHSYKEDIFSMLSKNFENLSDLDIFCIKKIAQILGITTSFINSSDLCTEGTKDNKLLEICHVLNADEYISGPAAKAYIDKEKFSSQRVKLTYYDYSGYPEYPQLWGEFNHYVSIIDLIFNCGEKAPYFIGRHRKNG